MMYKRVSLFFIAAIGLPATSCEHRADDAQFAKALNRVDRMIAAVDETIPKLVSSESKQWRAALKDLSNDLKANAQDVIANELNNLARRLPRDFGVQARATIDYLEAKIKGNLVAFKKALEKSRRDIELARNKKNHNVLPQIFANLAATKVFLDPVVTGVVPGQVRIIWRDHQQTTYRVRVPVVEVDGWGFENAKNSLAFACFIEDKECTLRKIPEKATFRTSRYLTQLNLNFPGIVFRAGDQALVIVYGPNPKSERKRIPILHQVPQPPKKAQIVAKPEKAIRAEVWFHTTGDNLENRGRVRYELLDQGSSLVRADHCGGGQNWVEGHCHKNEGALRIPLPVTPARRVLLRVECQTTERNRHVSWQARFVVKLHTNRRRTFVYSSNSHFFDTVDDRRYFNFEFQLPSPVK